MTIKIHLDIIRSLNNRHSGVIMFKKNFNVLLIIMMTLLCANLYSAEVHCNPSSKICHKEGTKNYNCKGSTVKFASEEEALKNGYRMSKQGKKAKKTKKGKEEKKNKKEAPKTNAAK